VDHTAIVQLQQPTRHLRRSAQHRPVCDTRTPQLRRHEHIPANRVVERAAVAELLHDDYHQLAGLGLHVALRSGADDGYGTTAVSKTGVRYAERARDRQTDRQTDRRPSSDRNVIIAETGYRANEGLLKQCSAPMTPEGAGEPRAHREFVTIPHPTVQPRAGSANCRQNGILILGIPFS
jgi:hypothetical protein